MAIRNFEGINKYVAEKEVKEQKEFEAKEQFVMGCLNAFDDYSKDLQDVIETERYLKDKNCSISLEGIGFMIDTANEHVEYYLDNKYTLSINPFTREVKLYFCADNTSSLIFLRFDSDSKKVIEMLYDKSNVIDAVLKFLPDDIQMYFERIDEIGK